MWERLKLRARIGEGQPIDASQRSAPPSPAWRAWLIAGVLCAGGLLMDTDAMAAPDAAMMAGPEKIARFIETGGASSLAGAFADSDVAILENFAPHLFTGPDAVARWSASMRAHLDGVAGLRHAFGAPQDFGRTGEVVFFSLPTRWTGVAHGKRFTEQGGWAFVLVRRGQQWRVRNYGWAVVSASYD